MQLYKTMKWHREKSDFLYSVSCNMRGTNPSMKLERIHISGDRKENYRNLFTAGKRKCQNLTADQ